MKNKIYTEINDCISDKAVNICELKAEDVKKTAKTLFGYYYASAGDFTVYENVVFDCSAPRGVKINYFDYLLSYKKRDFDEVKQKRLLKRANEKAFRVLLNEYIVNFKPKQISATKNLYFDITPRGKFTAVKKNGDKLINYDLSASEQAIFNFLCFIEINKFGQYVNGVKDFNYKEKPLFLINLPDYLDESFDYMAFLKEQKLNRKIIIIRDVLCTKNDALNFI